LKTITKSLTRYQGQRLYLLRMPARRLHRIENAEPTRSTESNYLRLYSELRLQELQRRINILRQAFRFSARAATLAEPAHIQRECVDSCIGQLGCHAAPRLAVAIALMQQQHAGAWLLCREIRSF